VLIELTLLEDLHTALLAELCLELTDGRVFLHEAPGGTLLAALVGASDGEMLANVFVLFEVTDLENSRAAALVVLALHLQIINHVSTT